MGCERACGEREKMLFERQDQAFLYIKRCGVYSCNFREKDLSDVSALELGIHFWRRAATWNMKLQMIDHSATGKVSFQHPRYTKGNDEQPRGVTRKKLLQKQEGGKPSEA